MFFNPRNSLSILPFGFAFKIHILPFVKTAPRKMRELEELRAKAEELEKLKAKLKKRDQQIASLQEAISLEIC